VDVFDGDLPPQKVWLCPVFVNQSLFHIVCSSFFVISSFKVSIFLPWPLTKV
jgi:hypothetical protein